MQCYTVQYHCSRSFSMAVACPPLLSLQHEASWSMALHWRSSNHTCTSEEAWRKQRACELVTMAHPTHLWMGSIFTLVQWSNQNRSDALSAHITWLSPDHTCSTKISFSWCWMPTKRMSVGAQRASQTKRSLHNAVTFSLPVIRAPRMLCRTPAIYLHSTLRCRRSCPGRLRSTLKTCLWVEGQDMCNISAMRSVHHYLLPLYPSWCHVGEHSVQGFSGHWVPRHGLEWVTEDVPSYTKVVEHVTGSMWMSYVIGLRLCF